LDFFDGRSRAREFYTAQIEELEWEGFGFGRGETREVAKEAEGRGVEASW